MESALDYLRLPARATILDPWIGSGTTAAAAAARGYHAVGYDLNPALVAIARARLVGTDSSDSIATLGEDLSRHAREDKRSLPQDPLGQWFDSGTIATIRRLERAINDVLIGAEHDELLAGRPMLKGVSPLACLYLTALFEVVRELAQNFRASNPTWIRMPRRDEPKAAADQVVVREAFVGAVRRLAGATQQSTASMKPGRARISVGDSRRLPLAAASVDATIASPPYCTRLDYVVATLPELAVLGYGRTETRAMRDAMVGTPTIAPVERAPTAAWGATATRAYEQVGEHPSHASRAYYARQLGQYFDGMANSIHQLTRVTKPGGHLCLVAQDSYYKELRIDLPEILTEMAAVEAWESVDRVEFLVPNTRAATNPGTRKYRTEFRATESVIVLRKPLSAKVIDD